MLMLLRLNVTLTQRNAYSRSMMMQLLNLLYQREHNLPSWQMYSRSTAVYNEEVGEHSFSILSRLVLGDTTKCSFAHMDMMYALIHTYRANNEDIMNDQYRKARPHKRYSIDKKHATLDAIRAFMLHVIRQVKADSFKVYSGKADKHNPMFKSAKEASAALMIRSETTKSMWDLANEIPLNNQINNMRKQARATYMGDWGGKYCIEQWPEMKSFVADAPVASGAPLAIERLEDENSSSGEEGPPVEESTSGEEPEDNSSDDSSDEDGPPPKDDVYDPYDEDQGYWPPTLKESEQEVPEKPGRGRGRPAGRGPSSCKRGRGK